VLTSENGVPVQVAKYVHGVGDSAKLPKIAKIGAFGAGLVARIARGYTYISRNYVPGDSIVIIGFSRGAYTARALAGLIARQGLLRPDLAAIDDNDRYDTAAAAWYRWKNSRNTTLQKIADGLTEFVELHKAFPNPQKLDDSCFVPADIAAVAVWDTVGALGIPFHHMGAATDPFRFSDIALSPKIRLGIHAVSIDEQRMQFQPTLWDVNDSRVTQALFAGDHCDVGGGYPDHGLSDGPLLWVVNRLKEPDIGVIFKDQPPCEVKPDPLGARHRAWMEDPIWMAAGVASRTFPNGIHVDASVHLRMKPTPEVLFSDPGNVAAYQPGNLPESIDAKANPIPISQPSPATPHSKS